MNTAELTSLVMASMALSGFVLQATVTWRSHRSGQSTARVASWTGLNNALDHDNQLLRTQVNDLGHDNQLLRTQVLDFDHRIVVMQDEMDRVKLDLGLARRRITLLESNHDDRNPERATG